MAIKIKSIFNILIILCGIIVFFFSIIGFYKFPSQKILFFILLSGSIIAVLLAGIDIYRIKIHMPANSIASSKLILSTLSGIILIFASIFLIASPNQSLFIKLIAIFGVIFFGIATTKGTIRMINKR